MHKFLVKRLVLAARASPRTPLEAYDAHPDPLVGMLMTFVRFLAGWCVGDRCRWGRRVERDGWRGNLNTILIPSNISDLLTPLGGA
jgi:hypothetical protein